MRKYKDLTPEEKIMFSKEISEHYNYYIDKICSGDNDVDPWYQPLPSYVWNENKTFIYAYNFNTFTGDDYYEPIKRVGKVEYENRKKLLK